MISPPKIKNWAANIYVPEKMSCVILCLLTVAAHLRSLRTRAAEEKNIPRPQGNC